VRIVLKNVLVVAVVSERAFLRQNGVPSPSGLTAHRRRSMAMADNGRTPVIPPDLDLIDGPYWAALTTVMPDGQPQTTPVWCNREGGYLLTNTMRGFRKEKNMRANPRVTLLVYDPHDPQRNIEVRGRVIDMTEIGAVEHNDRLAQVYLGKPAATFFGDAVPAALAATYVPVKVTIAPIHVRLGDPAPSASIGARSGLSPSGWLSEQKVHSEAASAPVIPADPLRHAPVRIPDTHRDLLIRPIHGILSTLLPDGQPHVSLVWVDYDGTHLRLNTALERRKCRNMQANPKVTLLVVDPQQSNRWIEVRGRVAEITTEGALPHADLLAQRYLGKQRFYGDVYERAWQPYETRVLVTIDPLKVSLDAVFAGR
jgi:PPOX class probable F420-dependent enzyme